MPSWRYPVNTYLRGNPERFGLVRAGRLLQAYDTGKFNTYEIRPDMAKIDPVTGKPTEIYDFKFDRDAMIDGDGRKLPGYKDDWQPGQKELYDDAVGEDRNHAVNNEECKCKAKK